MRYFTDGACYPNPGMAGWALIGENGYELSGRLTNVTNNQAELIAILKTLEIAKDGDEIYSDSQYSVNSIVAWFNKWKREGRLHKRKNIDLIEKCVNLYESKKLKISWIRRDSHELNERADQLSKEESAIAYKEYYGVDLPIGCWDFK